MASLLTEPLPPPAPPAEPPPRCCVQDGPPESGPPQSGPPTGRDVREDSQSPRREDSACRSPWRATAANAGDLAVQLKLTAGAAEKIQTQALRVVRPRLAMGFLPDGVALGRAASPPSISNPSHPCWSSSPSMSPSSSVSVSTVTSST